MGGNPQPMTINLHRIAQLQLRGKHTLFFPHGCMAHRPIDKIYTSMVQPAKFATASVPEVFLSQRKYDVLFCWVDDRLFPLPVL